MTSGDRALRAVTGPSERRPPPWECHGATAREDEQARTPTSYNNHMKMSAASGALRGARPFVGRGGRRDCTPVCRLCARRDDDVSYSLMLPEPRAHLPWDTPRATAATSATSTTSTTSDDDDDDDGDEEIRIAALQLRRPRQKPFCPSASRSMWGCRHQELRWLGGARASEATQSAPEELARLRVRFVSSTFLL